MIVSEFARIAFIYFFFYKSANTVLRKYNKFPNTYIINLLIHFHNEANRSLINIFTLKIYQSHASQILLHCSSFTSSTFSLPKTAMINFTFAKKRYNSEFRRINRKFFDLVFVACRALENWKNIRKLES